MVAAPAAPPTAAQVAMFGDATAKIRAAMAAKHMRPVDLNKAIGKPSSYTGSYQWLNGKGVPGPTCRAKVANALGLSVRDLMPRRWVKAGEPQEVAVVHKPPPAAAPVLSFSVTDDGAARLRLDITTPVNRGIALLRILLDAGMVVSQESDS